MISMTFKDVKPNERIFPNEEFDLTFKIEWFQDPLIQEMCLVIDKVQYIDGDYFKHPILGGFPARSLSSGLKTLILIFKADLRGYYIQTSKLGDNCWQFLKYLPKDRDLKLANNSFLPFDAFDNGLEIYLTEFDRTAKTFREYAFSKTEYGLSIGEC